MLEKVNEAQIRNELLKAVKSLETSKTEQEKKSAIQAALNVLKAYMEQSPSDPRLKLKRGEKTEKLDEFRDDRR